MKMPFGKHHGEDILDVDTGYLQWLGEQDFVEEKYPDLLNEVQFELHRRTAVERALDKGGWSE